MKKVAKLGILLIILGIVILEKDQIYTLLDKYLNKTEEDNFVLTKNEYYRDYNFNYIQNTDNLTPTNKQDILNIFYTAINGGSSTFSFKCPDEYEDCINEVKNLANDQNTLSDINNFVHPYNGFKHIETQYDNRGLVTITIQKSYTKVEIEEINTKIKEIEQQIINDQDTDRVKIQKVHDYIINNTIYDSDRSDNNIINYKSDIAYGPLIQGYGLCGGYTDAMELFLQDLNIKSFKVSSEKHVWNAINMDDNWYNLDLTWDDPVTSNKTNILEYNFFLINTQSLLEKEQEQHNFNQQVYSELKVSMN